MKRGSVVRIDLDLFASLCFSSKEAKQKKRERTKTLASLVGGGKGFNEKDSDAEIVRKGYEQDFMMCPPGYFLTDLVTFVTTHGSIEVIEAVAAIGCEHWLTSKKHYRGPRKGYIGSENPRGKLQWLRTPKNYIATGFNNRSGWLTDQIQIFSQRYKK